MQSLTLRIATILISCVALIRFAAAETEYADVTFETRCGSLANLANASYGPYDYTNPKHFSENLPVVEQYHFNSDVENLVQGMTASVYGDLNYTLRAFPNHHRALNSMARLELRDGVARGGKPAYCYFERAIRFNAQDAAVRQLYGIHLYRQKKYGDAIEQLETAVELAPNSAEAHYNLGLVLSANGQHAAAVEHAVVAMQLGYPLQGLVRKLERAGHWPPPEGVSDASQSLDDDAQ